MSKPERKAMIRRREDLSLSRQCHLVQISRSSLYYQAVGESRETLELMRQINQLYMQ